MTLTDELKITDDKIKANQAQYDLDREATNISALSSKELTKYEYLTGEDLGYKPGVVEQAKFEYSYYIFNKGLDKEDKREGFLKILKNVETINERHLEKQLKPIENDINNSNTNTLKKLRLLNKLSTVAKKSFIKLKS